MKNLVYVIFIVLSFGMVSCASMNNTNIDNSLLIIINENETNKRNDSFVYYRYRGDTFSIKINVMEKYQKINYFKPGFYTIKSMESVYIKTDSVARKFPFLINFNLKKDSVTIFPYKTVITLKNNKQYVDFVKLTTSDYTKCEEYINTQERYNGLAIIR